MMLTLYLSMIDDPQEQRKFERLYSSYRQTMYYVAYRVLNNQEDAEDAVHQAFLRVIDHMDDIDEEDKARTKSFLSIITKNVAIDIYRRNKKGAEHEISYDEYEIFIEDPNGQKFEEADVLTGVIAKLPPHYAEVIRLTYVHGYSSDQIGKILGLSSDNVRQRLVRARKKLEQMLNEEEQI